MTRKAPPAPAHQEWSAAQVETHAHAALTAALEYFRIPDHWEVTLEFSGAEPGNAGQIHLDITYLRGTIVLDTEHLRTNPAKVWETVGHEVAHLALAPYDALWLDLSEKTRDRHQNKFTRATENTVVQLTRMFLRDIPDPRS